MQVAMDLKSTVHERESARLFFIADIASSTHRHLQSASRVQTHARISAKLRDLRHLTLEVNAMMQN